MTEDFEKARREFAAMVDDYKMRIGRWFFAKPERSACLFFLAGFGWGFLFGGMLIKAL